jgi:hypothetical protein
MKRGLLSVIMFLLAGCFLARAESLQLPVSGIRPSIISEPASNILRDVSCRPVDIKVILNDVKPQKIDTEHLRNSRIAEYSV